MFIQVHKVMEHAAAVTYTGSASTVLLWGLHVSDVAVIISCTATVVGVGLQVWVAVNKVRLMRRSQRWDIAHRHDGQKRET